MEVDIYDFDKTVVPFDSGSLFWLYCLATRPWTVIFVPIQLVSAVLYAFRILNLRQMKKYFFIFLTLINTQKAVNGFWNRHEKQVYDWFKKENRARYSVIISASPDFLLEEIANRLEVELLLCTKHSKNGTLVGENCAKNEKVERLKQAFPQGCKVKCVYSDSLHSDKYIFSLGERCFNTVKGKLTEFSYDEKYAQKN